MLTTLLDDSEPSKIRKSIFIFASIVFFTYFYQLNVTAPKALFSSAASADKQLQINYIHILKMLMIFQLYLLIRLFLSFKISFAVFNKNWKIDEFKEDEDLVELKKELNNFNEAAKEKIFLKQNLVDVNSKLDQILNVHNEMSAAVTAACKITENTAANESNLNQLLQAENSISKTSLQDISHIYHFKCNELPVIGSEIRNVIAQVNTHKEALKSCLSGLTEFETKLTDFNQTFPNSNYRAVTAINQKSLINSRKFKVAEMMIFEFFIPVVICGLSLVVCWSPNNTWLSKIITMVF